MATTDLYGQYANPATPEILGLERQRQFAKMLMAQSQQPQGQMVSGRYVAPAWTQQLQAALNPVVGALLSTSADKKALQIAEQLRNKEAQDINKFFEYQYGRSAEVAPQGDTLAGEMISPAVERNPQMAYQIAAQSQSPILRQQLAEMLKGRTLKEDETYYRYNPLKGVEEPVIQGMPKLSPELRDAAREAKVDIRNIDNWTPEDWQKVRTIQAQVNAQKQPVTNLTVNTGKAYTSAFGEGIAKGDIDKFDVAQKAPSIYQNAITTEQLLDKGAITGLGATYKLNLARALNVAGANNNEIIKNTEQLVANRGQIVLDSIKASGLGAGQGFTNTDRQFLEKVKGGTIELNSNTLRELARIEKNIAQATVDNWNKRLPNIPQEAIRGTGVGPVQLPNVGGAKTVDFNSLPK